MGGNGNYYSGINENWSIVWDFPRSGMGMGGNGYTKVIPAHLYCWYMWRIPVSPRHTPPISQDLRQSILCGWIIHLGGTVFPSLWGVIETLNAVWKRTFYLARLRCVDSCIARPVRLVVDLALTIRWTVNVEHWGSKSKKIKSNLIVSVACIARLQSSDD